MCYSFQIIFLMMLIMAKTISGSTEEQRFNYYAPSTRDFHDIYHHTPTVIDEEIYSTTEKDSINIIQTQLVEFHQTLTTDPPTVPPPKYIQNPIFVVETTRGPQETTSTTEDQEFTIKVVPIKKNYQRGLLDLLFPPRRVKSFKNVFDSIRRVLSHTFRR